MPKCMDDLIPGDAEVPGHVQRAPGRLGLMPQRRQLETGQGDVLLGQVTADGLLVTRTVCEQLKRIVLGRISDVGGDIPFDPPVPVFDAPRRMTSADQ